MYQVIIVIHILLGLGIIGLIMMQQGKGADAGAGFGAGASGSVFGAQGSASFLSRMTALFATLFFATSLGLAWLNSHKGAAVDIIGSFDKENSASSGIIAPSIPIDKPVVPPLPESGSSIPGISSDMVPEHSVNESAPAVQPPTVAPAAESHDAQKASDVPVVEEKNPEQKAKVEQKIPRAKKK